MILVVNMVYLLAYNANIYLKNGTVQNKVLNINIYLTRYINTILVIFSEVV